MDAIERELLCGEVDVLAGEVASERFRHMAGLEAAPSLAAHFRAHSRAAHRATLKALEEDGVPRLAAAVGALRVERAQAEAEEAWRAAETTSTGQGPDGPVTLAEAQRLLPAERRRERRLDLGRAMAEAAILPARDEAVERRASARAEVGLTPDWELVTAADALLAASGDAYGDVLSWLAAREAELALPPRGDLTRADLLFVLALHGWEGLFPGAALAPTLTLTAGALRLDLTALKLDEQKRDARWPGAHALGPRVALGRQGGAADWLGLFDAAGQALVAARVPFHRRPPAAPFTLGALLAGLLLDRGFLRARLEVERRHQEDLVRALALRQLFRLRARAAALRVATEVERGMSGAAWHEAHREALSTAGRATWPLGLASRDGDAGLLGAQLRGWATAEALRSRLVERCDEDWWRNPRSAELLQSFLAAPDETAGEEPPLALAAQALAVKM